MLHGRYDKMPCHFKELTRTIHRWQLRKHMLPKYEAQNWKFYRRFSPCNGRGTSAAIQFHFRDFFSKNFRLKLAIN
jgi:hypothetical protein